MSKTTKISMAILILLLLLSLVGALYYLLESQKAKDENIKLNQELNQTQDREKKNLSEIKNLNDGIAKANAEKDRLNEKVKKAEKTAEDLYAQITEITQDRDKWKGQIDSIAKERDELVEKIRRLEDEAIKKEKEAALQARQNIAAPQLPQMESQPQSEMAESTMYTPPAISSYSQPEISSVNTNDQYWASVLKDKASLEVKIENLNQELAKKNSEIIDLKQYNADFKMKLESLQHDKEDVERDIQYKSDMVNNLSLELARSKNDKKFVADQITKLNDENGGLRKQIQQLVASKGALEKSILRLTQERNEMDKKLTQTETIVQSKIDEIWNIKDSLDQSVETVKKAARPGEVELPPIVVSSDAQAVNFNSGMVSPGFNGKIASINEDNNFVIIDVGENTGIRLGDILSVYRDSKYIARLEVIQVRKDISAADIKDQWTKVQVGDTVR